MSLLKYSVTPELAILLKTLRMQNGVSAKDLAQAVGKSPSYISKLEAGDVKHIQKELLTSIITFISGGGDFYEDCLANAVKVLNSFIEPERRPEQLWLLQYDIVDRPLTMPAAMAEDLTSRLKELDVSVEKLVDYINQNLDSEMSSGFPDNVLISVAYEEGNRLLLRVHLEQDAIEKLLKKKDLNTNYLTINTIVHMVMRFTNYGDVLEKLPVEKAVQVLEDTSAYMQQFGVHSLTGFSHMLSSKEFIERQQPLAFPFERVEDSTVNDAILFFKEAMEHDAVNTKKALNSFVDALNWDPGFTMKLISIPFSDLEGLSFQNKRKLLEEIGEVVERFNQMSDYEKKLESY